MLCGHLSCKLYVSVQTHANAARSGELLGIIRVVLLLEQPGRVERARDERCRPQQSTPISGPNALRMSSTGRTILLTEKHVTHMQHVPPNTAKPPAAPAAHCPALD